MSEEEFKIPRKFTFDEFYEMLKEYVNDPKAREALATYDSEDAAGHGELLDGSQCSELAFESYSDFRIVGWNILAKNGWPTYLEIVNIKDMERRFHLMHSGDIFWKLARRLIRKEPKQKGWDFQDYDFEIKDRESVLSLLKMCEKKYSKHTEIPYFITAEDE